MCVTSLIFRLNGIHLILHEKLDMLGYDMSWASFHVVEVMSSPRVHLKSVGYLAAVQSFEQDTDVLMLTTNLLKKVGNSPLSLDLLLHPSLRIWALHLQTLQLHSMESLTLRRTTWLEISHQS